jgi:hypothetical protein
MNNVSTDAVDTALTMPIQSVCRPMEKPDAILLQSSLW